MAQNVSSINATTGVFTMNAAHGMPVGQAWACTTGGGTLPSGLNALNAYYVRWLSTTTFALYNNLSDAKNDVNRITGTGTGNVGWTLRTLTPNGVDQKGFDPVAPLGGWAAHSTMFWELNLANPLITTSNVIVLLERINGMFDNATPSASHGSWGQGTAPTIINPNLIRFDSTSCFYAYSGSPLAQVFQGSWTSQGNTTIYFGFVVVQGSL
jgi:hypothetical protein